MLSQKTRYTIRALQHLADTWQQGAVRLDAIAAIRTRADKVDGGWRLNGRKIWTTNAHRVHYIIALVRTSPADGSRHAGLSQFIVDLDSEGVQVRPIISMTGQHHFNVIEGLESADSPLMRTLLD